MNFGSFYVRNWFLVTKIKEKKTQLINKFLVFAKWQYQLKEVCLIFQKKHMHKFDCLRFFHEVQLITSNTEICPSVFARDVAAH